MDPLTALGQIFLQAIPTFILVWILYLYTTRIFFRPLQKTLRKRYESTAGLRQAAEGNIDLAARKTAEYEQALRSAWTEVYRQQEQERQRALEQRADIVRLARRQAEELIRRTQQEIRGDVEEAKKRLAAEIEPIAHSITTLILRTGETPSTIRAPGGAEAGR